ARTGVFVSRELLCCTHNKIENYEDIIQNHSKSAWRQVCQRRRSLECRRPPRPKRRRYVLLLRQDNRGLLPPVLRGAPVTPRKCPVSRFLRRGRASWFSGVQTMPAQRTGSD